MIDKFSATIHWDKDLVKDIEFIKNVMKNHCCRKATAIRFIVKECREMKEKEKSCNFLNEKGT